MVSSVVFSHDGKYILSGSWDKTIKVLDFTSGSEMPTWEGNIFILRYRIIVLHGNDIEKNTGEKV